MKEFANAAEMGVTALAQHCWLGVPLGAAQLGAVALASGALALYNGALRCAALGRALSCLGGGGGGGGWWERPGCCGACAGEGAGKAAV
jgi:hypothetical protein